MNSVCLCCPHSHFYLHYFFSYPSLSTCQNSVNFFQIYIMSCICFFIAFPFFSSCSSSHLPLPTPPCLSLPFVVAIDTIDPGLLKGVLPSLSCIVSHVTTVLALSQGQTAIMKTDWSQQRPHTWQAGRAAPCCLFQTAPSLTAECRRHLNQWTAQVPLRAVPESGSLWRDFKMKRLFTAHMEQWFGLLCHFSPLLAMDGCQRHIWPEKRRRSRGKKRARERKKRVCVYETEKNRQSWRTDWLLGKAFCHMKTLPPLHPIPVIQALSVKDTQTDSPENLGSRLSQLSSHLIKVLYASSAPPHFSFAEC